MGEAGGRMSFCDRSETVGDGGEGERTDEVRYIECDGGRQRGKVTEVVRAANCREVCII
jgi:hypothetical protein